MFRFLLASAFLVTATLVNAQQCPSIYKRFNSRHSYCLLPNPQCTMQVRKVNEAEKLLILRKHNEYRSKIATGREDRAGGMPKASNMLEMEWDDELADVAQKWAEHCEFHHDCNTCKQVEAFPVGQNMGLNYKFWKLGKRGDWETFLTHLYEEIESREFWNSVVDYFTPGPPPLHPDQYGHLTQMIWANSWKVGCGYAYYTKQGKEENFFVCNYGPSGNVAGEKIYKRGEPCSDCPTNTCCGSGCNNYAVKSSYSGLCKVVNPFDPPLPFDTRRYLFRCDFNYDCPSTKSNNLWKLVKTPGGTWESTVLNGGQSTRITLNRKFYPTGSFVCIYTFVRGGPNEEGKRFALQVSTNIHNRGEILPMNIGYILMQFDNEDRHVFSPLKTNIELSGETQFSFDVKVPQGSPAQFFEVQKVVVTESKFGRCPWSPDA